MRDLHEAMKPILNKSPGELLDYDDNNSLGEMQEEIEKAAVSIAERAEEAKAAIKIQSVARGRIVRAREEAIKILSELIMMIDRYEKDDFRHNFVNNKLQAYVICSTDPEPGKKITDIKDDFDKIKN